MKEKIKHIWKFLTYDIWRITEDEVTSAKFYLYNVIKAIYLCVDRFIKDRLINKASALTYSTLLAIVPILAILFAIAKGFGVSAILEEQLKLGFIGNSSTSEMILRFVDAYLNHTKSGIFIGIGIIMLLWTVSSLLNSIEITFNRIWDVKKGRSIYRKITDYFSMLLILPILIVASGGISLFMSTILKDIEGFALLAPIAKFLIRSIPFVITWFLFTGLYMFMPNTKVKFRHAIVAGILAGTAYQAFQLLYINSQLWVSRYNAIYGSFAALPLLLLWMQISWAICLFGAELTYARQNVKSYSFDKDIRNVSRRYRDFLSILIMSLIAKRFEKNLPPYTAEELSTENQIPIRLTKLTLSTLQDIHLIHEVATDHKSDPVCFQTSIDINQLNIALLLERLDTYGSENFKIDRKTEFEGEWKILIDTRQEYYDKASQILLKDL